MSADDAILFRKVEEYWYVIPEGSLSSDVDVDDDEFFDRAELVLIEQRPGLIIETMKRLQSYAYVEHGIIYACKEGGCLCRELEIPAEHLLWCPTHGKTDS